MQEFLVTVANSEFQLNGARFPVDGVNCYFLAYCSETSRRAALLAARQIGANVVRTWAFPGLADRLENLDAVIKAAEELGLKLILPFINYWEAFYGMPTYLNLLDPGADVTEFYRQNATREAYKNWVSSILTRRNTLTGRLYSEEPSIMAWELTNEARCPLKGGRELLLSWVTEMAAFVKQHDSNHLLALGDEGMFYQKSSGHLYDGRYGVDWIANLAISNIDFGTFHFYPQDWGLGQDLNFAERWIEDHVTAARDLNKPALMEEFGLRLDGDSIRSASDRDFWFAQWRETVQESGGAGQLLWMLGYAGAEDTKGFVDAYTVYA